MRAFETEAQLAATVVDWLKRGGWDVYQEVQLNSGGRRADIIAVDCLKRIWVIECKNAFSTHLVDQALFWKEMGVADRVSVAIPAVPGALCLNRICVHEGL